MPQQKWIFGVVFVFLLSMGGCNKSTPPSPPAFVPPEKIELKSTKNLKLPAPSSE
jgi:hypothetical protein